MPPRHDELAKPWKIPVNATLAGKIEFMLSDPLTHKPGYGARKALIEALLEWWVAREAGNPLPDVPSLESLRSL